jgi:hypothetical protein
VSGKHALYSPSGFGALMLCPAKPAMERGLLDVSSEFADEGTGAHFLGAECLRQDTTPVIGDVIAVHAEGTCDWLDGMPKTNRHPDSRYFTVDADFAKHVQTYIDVVRDYQGPDGELFVEQPLPIDHITGEEDAEGTGDAIILRGDEIIVIDLKFGRGVEVSAEDNPQLKLYALGALAKFDLVGEIRRARMVICQPRAGGTSEAVATVEELQAWADEKARPAAQLAQRVYALKNIGEVEALCKPHEDACRFCKAKPCRAMDAAVQDALQREFTDLTTANEPERDAIVETSVATADAAGALGAKMDAVPLVEMWCKAVRARVEKHLIEGRAVAGYKLVEGKRGNRKWADEVEAEKALKAMRLKKEQMYSFEVISPTAAEKLLKPTPKRWKKVQALITQNDGKPSVAPVADKRPALQVQPLEAEFAPITETSTATADDLV